MGDLPAMRLLAMMPATTVVRGIGRLGAEGEMGGEVDDEEEEEREEDVEEGEM